MRLVVVRGPEMVGPFELVPGSNVIGRDPGAQVRLPSRRVSRRHAILLTGESQVVIRDLDSSNGLVDEAGRRLAEMELRPGQRVQIGDFVLRLEEPEEIDLEVELDDPATAESELQLEDEDEDTPAQSGPVPVLRPLPSGRFVPPPPDPGSATLDGTQSPFGKAAKSQATPAPRKVTRAPAAAPPPLAELPPLAANPAALPSPAAVDKPPFPAPPSVGSARPTLPPTITAVPPADPLTAETSSRMPPPLLPFGPPTGGFATFAPKPAAAPKPAPAAPPPREDDTPFANQPPPLAAPPAPAPPPAAVAPPPAVVSAAPAAAPAPPPLPPLPPYREDSVSVEVGGRSSTRLPPVRSVEPARSAAGGLPWAVQAALVLGLAGGLLVCAPVGGVFGQVWGASSAAEELSLQRGEALAAALGERNAAPLAGQRLIGLDTAFILHEPGVREAAVTDVVGSVLVPPERAHTSLARAEAFVAANASHAPARAEAADGTWEIVTPIRGEVSAGSGARSIVGWTWMRYDPSVAAAAAGSPWIGAFAGIFVVLAAGAIVAAGGWWLVVRPLVTLRDETEHALLDHVDKVVPSVRWPLLDELAHSINRAITRARGR